jgi:hypothetical protein
MVKLHKLTRRGLIAGLGGSALAGDAALAEAKGYRTVLFDAAASWDEARGGWRVPVHAWVYAPQTSTVRKGAIAALFKRKFGLVVSPEGQALFDARINLLLADNKRGQMPRATAADTAITLGKTSANGHTRGEVFVPKAAPAVRDGGWLSVIGDGAQARAHLIPPMGMSVISDIDDTVKDSVVLDKKRLFESTFYKPFKAVPGMADLLKRLAGRESVVHYVSSSPWHLYQPLRAWLAADAFPVSSLHLKHIRLKDSTILDITKSPEETKPPIIADLLKRYPQRQFILVGDSGEKDPEVYGAMARQALDQVVRILIRRAPGDQTPPERFDAAFAGIPRDRWQVFTDPTEVR